MTLFIVHQIANRPSSTNSGYAQSFEAKESDGRLAAIVLEFGWDSPEHIYEVQSRNVVAETGYEAIRLFREWLVSGHSSSWLINPEERKGAK